MSLTFSSIINLLPGFFIFSLSLFSAHKDDQLVTRLQNIFPPHQTTDDSTDYDDYPLSIEIDSSDDDKPTHFNLPLPLIPIIDDNDTSIYTIAEGVDQNGNTNDPTVVQYGIEFDNSSFLAENNSNFTTIHEQNITTNLLTNDNDNEESPQQHDNNNEIHEEKILNENESDRMKEEEWNDEKNKNENESDENVTESTAKKYTLEHQNEIPTSATTVVIELHDENDSEAATTTEHVMSFNLESLEEKSEAEKAISNSSNPITTHLVDDYFDAMLLNDSLITIDSTSYSNVTESDYDITTAQEIETTTIAENIDDLQSQQQHSSLSSSDLENISYKVEDISTSTESQSILQHHENDKNEEFHHELNEYHYETVTENIFSVLNTLTSPPTPPPSPSTPRTTTPFTHFIRFPDDNNNDERKHLTISQASSQQVKFPDEPDLKQISRQSSTPSLSSSSFTWPRDNGYVSFWREQPLINDSKAFSSGFSRGIISSFNRHNHASYRGAYG